MVVDLLGILEVELLLKVDPLEVVVLQGILVVVLLVLLGVVDLLDNLVVVDLLVLLDHRGRLGCRVASGRMVRPRSRALMGRLGLLVHRGRLKTSNGVNT